MPPAARLELSAWVWRPPSVRHAYMYAGREAEHDDAAIIAVQAAHRGRVGRRKARRLAAMTDAHRLVALPPSRNVNRTMCAAPTRSLTDLLMAAGGAEYQERYYGIRIGTAIARSPRRDRRATATTAETTERERPICISSAVGDDRLEANLGATNALQPPQPLVLFPPDRQLPAASPRALDQLRGPVTPPTSPLEKEHPSKVMSPMALVAAEAEAEAEDEGEGEDGHEDEDEDEDEDEADPWPALFKKMEFIALRHKEEVGEADPMIANNERGGGKVPYDYGAYGGVSLKQSVVGASSVKADCCSSDAATPEALRISPGADSRSAGLMPRVSRMCKAAAVILPLVEAVVVTILRSRQHGHSAAALLLPEVEYCSASGWLVEAVRTAYF